MNDGRLVIWVCAGPETREQAQPLLRALEGQASPLVIGPAGQPAPDLRLDPGADLGLALTACPASLRPRACVWVAANGQEPPQGWEGLPCPVLGWGAAGPDGKLPAPPQEAAAALLQAARAGFRLPWMAKAQVNMPLLMLLEEHYELVESLPALNLEVGIDWQALERLGEHDLARAGQALKNRRITCHLPFGDLVAGSPDPLVRRTAAARLERAGAWAMQLGACQAVMHLGYDQRMHPDAQIFAQRLAETLGGLARSLNQNGCALALENVFEPDAAPLLAVRQALIETGAEQVGFCLDVGHARTFSATPLEGWLREIGRAHV
jgi:sugar phosphate isomerase/epimerase